MANYRTSRIIPVALIIIIIVIAVAALVSLARVVFSGSDGGSTVVDTSREALLSTTAEHSVSMRVRGPIVANEDFRSYEIIISPNTRTIKTYSGYLEKLVAKKSLSNTVASYEQFVNALDKANLALGDELEGTSNDVRGVCATGELHEFTILKDKKPVKYLWTSTCKKSQGSLEASVSQLSSLFIAQIPNSEDLIDDVDL